jgi:AAA domain
MTLNQVTSRGSGLPSRYILHGCEKTGKTSFAAYTPSPVFIQTKGETGLETLIEAGRLSEVPHFPEIQSFDGIVQAIEELIEQPHDYKTLVIDTLNGAERLCHEEVCRRDYGGDMGERGFTGYMRGYEVSLVDWRNLLTMLDTLREKRRMAILCLCHTKVKPFRNPEGADYDRYAPDMHDKTWGLSHKWSDAVLFLNYETFVDEKDPKKRGKATSTQARILYTERHAAYDAGNRFGLPNEIDMGNSGQEAWNNFIAALKTAKQTSNGKEGV